MAKEKDLLRGLALVWDDRGCETKEQIMDSFIEFMEFSFYGLKKHYDYTHFVFAMRKSEDGVLNDFPSCAGVCRGSENVLALNMDFTKSGLYCTTERISSVERKIKAGRKIRNNTRKVLTEKTRNNG